MYDDDSVGCGCLLLVAIVIFFVFFVKYSPTDKSNPEYVSEPSVIWYDSCKEGDTISCQRVIDDSENGKNVINKAKAYLDIHTRVNR